MQNAGLLKKLEENLLLRNYSKETIKGYLLYAGKYVDFAKNKGINKESAKDFILIQLKKKEPASVGHIVFALKYFFSNILNEKLNIPNPKRNKTIPVILTKEEIKSMIDSTSNIKHRLIIKVLYGCGLRVSEITNLRKDDLNFNEKLMHICLGKGKKDRFVKIPETLIEELKSYCLLNKEEIYVNQKCHSTK